MHKLLLRSKTRIQLKKVASVFVCFTMAMPMPALAQQLGGTAPPVTGGLPGQAGQFGPGGQFGQQQFDPNEGARIAARAQHQKEVDEFNKGEEAKREAFQQSLRDHKKQVASLRNQAAAMKAEAQREAAKIFKDTRQNLDTLEPLRAAMVGRLEPKPIKPSDFPEKKKKETDLQDPDAPIAIGPEKKGEGPKEDQTPKAESTNPAPMPKPEKKSSSLLDKTFNFLVSAFGIPEAFAVDGSYGDAGQVEKFDPTQYSVSAIENQMEHQVKFDGKLGVAGQDLLAGKLKTYNSPGAKEDYTEKVRQVARDFGVEPEDAVTAVKRHLDEMRSIVTAERKPAKQTGDANKTDATSSDHGLAPTTSSVPIATSTNDPTLEGEIESRATSDLDRSINQVKKILNAGITALGPAKEKEIAAEQKEKEASELEANPPSPPKPGTPPKDSGAGNQQAQQQRPQPPGGGQGGGNGNGNGKGAAGQGGVVPQAGGIADSSKLFGSPPETPDVSSVAQASAIEPRQNPKWETIPGGVQVPPGILRATGNTPVTPTSGQVAQAGPPFIQGNMSPGSPIDKSLFGGGGGGGGEGGGEKAPSGGGGGGGGAGGAFGGDDVGRGIGPSYGGRAGLSDAVKRYEVGAGGGSTTSETSSATIATGAEGGIPQGLANQISTGKKGKDAGRGGLGILNNVYSLVQAQCGDQTQRAKFEAFCINASSVGAKSKGKKGAPEQDQLAMAGGARRDLASDRGVTSSK